MKKYVFSLIALLCVLFAIDATAQIQFVNYPLDTVGWVRGSSQSALHKRAKYDNDTFVINTAAPGENNFLYHATPVLISGVASTFMASFDFKIDSSSACSDGLTFWFLSGGLSNLGCVCHEGSFLGFPDTTKGLALTMKTTSCSNTIYLKKINSTAYVFGSGSSTITDSNIAATASSQMWLTDSNWHHCVVVYAHGHITVSFDGGAVTMSGFSPISGFGRFGFMATNGTGYSRKCLKNIHIDMGLGSPTVSSGSFGTSIYKHCNGPQIVTHTNTYTPGYNLKTWYGDGSYDLSPVLPGGAGGYVVLDHTYPSTGTYTVKQVLQSGTGPVDSLSTGYENVLCTTIPVNFYYDANNNCIKDSNEIFMIQPLLTEVDSNGVAVDYISTTSGFYYQAHGGAGTIYTFKVLSVPGDLVFTCPSTGIVHDTVMIGGGIAGAKYIGLNCPLGSSFDLGVNAVVTGTGRHRQEGDIYVHNASCLSMDATVTLRYSPKYDGLPVVISPYPVSVGGNTITWNISGLASSDSTLVKLHYRLNTASDMLPIGDTVHSHFVIEPGIVDVDTSDNCQEDVDTVKAGYDPNHIWVSPEGCMPLSVSTTNLKYTVNFENTGNDTAHNIYVLDTLSEYLDASSLRMVMASHEMYVSKWKDAAGRTIVKFDFPDIKLLDSSHHGLCDGAFIYTINTKPAIPAGDIVHARVGIYFDANEVVHTNTAENKKGCPSELLVLELSHTKPALYPNPVSDVLVVRADQNVFTSFTIANSIGQEILQKQISGGQTHVNVKALPAGIYYVVFTGAHGREMVKFVKE